MKSLRKLKKTIKKLLPKDLFDNDNIRESRFYTMSIQEALNIYKSNIDESLVKIYFICCNIKSDRDTFAVNKEAFNKKVEDIFDFELGRIKSLFIFHKEFDQSSIKDSIEQINTSFKKNNYGFILDNQIEDQSPISNTKEKIALDAHYLRFTIRLLRESKVIVHHTMPDILSATEMLGILYSGKKSTTAKWRAEIDDRIKIKDFEEHYPFFEKYILNILSESDKKNVTDYVNNNFNTKKIIR